LHEIFAERKELIAKYVPAETQAIHARVITELKQKGIAGGALPTGAKAPSFELKDHNAKLISSGDLLAQGPARGLFFSWTLVSLLCGATGSYEPHPATN
jgi:hypothetical protein